ncbi:hypothetical protein QZH56_37025 (plasmid) [Streptomyces olivoreticuli]|uniref:hypothetical protein n=1 Tax=Streptomyces olivoreticuli TaxID=68246 RepID=UPI00265A0CC1|nr:hypothetical protein [Streptomyces olivoreticuli]WKK27856.1 hypothetical protein QZH56_37025 [Streptomyces olivoreticuli]
MTTHTFTAWAAANPWPTLAAVVLVLVLVAAVVWWLRSLWAKYLGTKPLAVRFGILAALACSAASIDTSWRYARDHLHIDVVTTRVIVFGGAEVLLVAMALFARHQLLGGKKAVGGGAGVGVWVLSGLLCVPAFTEFGFGGGCVRTIFGPIGAAIAMHKTVLTELQERDPEAERIAERVVRTLRDKLLARFGLADLDQDAKSIARTRALARATELVEQLAGIPATSENATGHWEKRQARRQKKRRTALLAELRTALREAGVRPHTASSDPIDVLLADLTVARHAESLLELKTASPWQRHDPAAHELAQQVRHQWTTADERIRSKPLSAAERLAQRGLPLPAITPGRKLFTDVETCTTEPTPAQPETAGTGNQSASPEAEPVPVVPAPPAHSPATDAAAAADAPSDVAGEPVPASGGDGPEPVPAVVPATPGPGPQTTVDGLSEAAVESAGNPVPGDVDPDQGPEPEPVPEDGHAVPELLREPVPVPAVAALGIPRLQVHATVPEPVPGTPGETATAPDAEAVPAQTGTGPEPAPAPSGEPVPGDGTAAPGTGSGTPAGTAPGTVDEDGVAPAGTGADDQREPVPGDGMPGPGTGSAVLSGTGDGQAPGTGPGDAPEPACEDGPSAPGTGAEPPSDQDREPHEDDGEAPVPERYRVLVPALVELLDEAKRSGEKPPTVAAVAREFRIRKEAAGPLLRHAKTRVEEANGHDLSRS